MSKRPTKEQYNQQIESMAKVLRDEMIDGKYKAGDFLPSEKSLMERFQLSNHSIRGGLDLLVQEGWLEKIPRVGNRVATGRPRVNLTLECNVVTLRNLELRGLLEEFHSLYPWITVHLKVGGAIPGVNLDTNTISSDIIIVDSFQFQQMVEYETVKELAPLTMKPDIYPMLNHMYSDEGQLYMLPIVMSPLVLCYNKEHFREKGLVEPNGSWTWTDLIRNAEILSEGNKRYGFGFHIQSIYRWPMFLLQSGECFEWDGSNLADFRGSKLLDSIKLCKEILHNRKAFPLYLSDSNDDTHYMFMDGKISMTLNTYMGFNGWNHGELEYDISPVPNMGEMRTLLTSLGVGICRHSPNQEEAMLLLDFLTSSQAQGYIQKHTLSIPSLASLPIDIGDKTIYRPSRFMLFREIMATFRSLSDLNIPTNAFKPLFDLLKAYWASLIDEDELCERISRTISDEKK